MPHPLISIIMPVYGVERYLAAALESVLAQTETDWELIVVDDGSPDASATIASEYVQRDRRIRLMRKENEGLSAARNDGLALAQGEYVHFFDSDDWIEPCFYEHLLAVMTPEDAFAMCGYTEDVMTDRGEVLRSIPHRCPRYAHPSSDINEKIGDLRPHLNFAWNKLYRTAFLREHRLLFQEGLRWVEDCEYFARVMACAPRFHTTPSAGYHYAVRPRTTLSNFFSEQMLDVCTLRQEATTRIYHHLGVSSAKAQALLADCAETSVRAYLHQRFTNGEDRRLRSLWRDTATVLRLPALRQALRNRPVRSPLSLAIQHGCAWAVFALYSLKTAYRHLFALS